MSRTPVVVLLFALAALTPGLATAGASPLEAAFERHVRAVETAGRDADVVLSRWLGMVQWSEWIAGDRFEAATTRLARRVGASAAGPLVRLEQARLAVERGAFDEARALAAADGWLASGVLTCGDGPAGWRLALPPWAQPVPLDRLAALGRGASCRLRVVFVLAEPDRVQVGFDGPSGASLRVDGESVALRDSRGGLLPDGELVELDLVDGRHVLEIQFADAAAAGLEPVYLRVRPTRGALAAAPTASSAWLSEETAAPLPVPRPPRGVRRLDGTRARLERLAERSGDDACDAALLLGRVAPDPFCGSLVLRRDDSRALTRRHDEPAALFFFSQVLDRAGQGASAAEILRYALKRADFVDARVAWLNLLAERGARRVVTDELERVLGAGAGGSSWTGQGLLRLLTLTGNDRRARTWLQGRLSRRLDPELGLALLARLEADGDAAATLAESERLLRAWPWLVAAELAAVRARLQLSPGADVTPRLSVVEWLGGAAALDAAQILRAAGRDADAARVVEAVLDENPSSERARLLALALGKRDDGLDPVFGPLDAAALRARARELASAGGRGLVGLDERQRRVVATDGTSRTWSRAVLARLDATPAAATTHTFVLHEGTETLSFPRLTLLKRDGGAFELPEDRVEASNDAPDGVVDETVELAVPLGDLEPGDVLVIEALRVSRGLPGLRERPADLVFFRREYPVRESRAEIVVPRRWTLSTGLFSKQSRLASQVTEASDDRTFQVTARDLPAWDDGDDDYAAWSTYSSWSELGYEYGGRFARALTGREEVADLAARVTAGRKSTAERVDALHRFVSDNVRYFGVELGEHAYVPYPVQTVLQRGYGDCKDKAALLAMLLADVGVHAVPVLVAGADGVELDPRLPMLDVFNHLLLYLPEEQRFLDPTLPRTPPGYLPSHVAGRAALVIDGSTAPRRLPEQDPGDNQFREELAWSAAGPGRFHVQGTVTLTGELAFPFRDWLDDPVARADGVADLLRALFPTLEVDAAEASLDDTGRVPALLITLAGVDASMCTQEAGAGPGGRRCSGFARDPRVLREAHEAWGRSFPYVYKGMFHLPSLPAEQVSALPPFRRVATARAQLKVETALEGRDVLLTVGYRQDRRRLPAKDAEALKAAWVGQPTEVTWTRGAR